MTQNKLADFTYILGAVLLTAYSQLVVKWQVAKAGTLPVDLFKRMLFLVNLLLNPWIISGMAAGLFALICSLAAMTKFDLSYVYPFMSLTFVLVLILSGFLFHEAVTVPKVLGVLLIIAGIIFASRG